MIKIPTLEIIFHLILLNHSKKIFNNILKPKLLIIYSSLLIDYES